MKYLYIAYQYLIALPILFVLTVICAVTTICTIPWKNSAFVHLVQQIWARSFCRLMFIPVTVTGLENIKPGQSYVFVSNHESMFDVFVIYGWLPVVYKWLMKKELRKVPFVGSACAAAGHIFVDRSNPRASMESIKAIERILVNGVCTVIFPEGTRSKDGQLGRFKRGAFQVAFDASLPVIPISLSGCYEAMSRSAKYVTRHPIHMHIGEPISLEQFNKDEPQAAMDYVREAVQRGIDD